MDPSWRWADAIVGAEEHIEALRLHLAPPVLGDSRDLREVPPSEKHGERVSVTRTPSNTLKNDENTLKYNGIAKIGTAGGCPIYIPVLTI